MKRSKKPLTSAEAAKRIGISQEQFEAQARKQADEYLGIHPLTPQEKLASEEQAKAYSSFNETFRRDARRRAGVSVPFPLEDIFYYTDETGPPDGVYDHDDPEFLERTSIAAYGAINDYRMFFYKPGLSLNKEQLKIATDVALDIRAQKHDLKNIPLAENPDCPTDEDFIRLGQWFLDAHTAITEDIVSRTAKEKTLNADEGLIVLTEPQSKILKYLKGINIAVAQLDIESQTGLSNKTVSAELRVLKEYNFVAPPKGKIRRIVITQKGVDYLNALT